MSVTHYPCIKVNFPEIFTDEFMEWLNSSSSSVATWHPGGKAGEWSDVFVWVENGEGSDSDMPDSAWSKVVELADAHLGGVGIVWITNLKMEVNE